MKKQSWERFTLPPLALLAATGAIVGIYAFREGHRPPVVVRYDVATPRLHGAPLTIALISDTHVADSMSIALDVKRLERDVDAVNGLHPDIIILGGDYVSSPAGGKVAFDQAIAPFKRLRARLGVFAVLGNHDYGQGGAAKLAAAFRAIGVRPLVNQTADLGPFVLAGLDDLWKGQSDIGTATRALHEANGRPVVLVSHNPDVFPHVPHNVALTLAGHTHGGQIVLPVVGPIASSSRYGRRYRRGLIVEHGHAMIVTSGLGGFALRLGVPPEIALITLKPGR